MLEYYANIAEIIGVVFVVVTLAFLILQIRQNTLAMRAETLQAVMQSEMVLSSLLVEHASVWDKVLHGAPLDDGEETRRAVILHNCVMIETETRFQQHLAGFLDAKSWQARLQMLPGMVSLPVFRASRQSVGGHNHAANFLELVDRVYKRGAEQEEKDG